MNLNTLSTNYVVTSMFQYIVHICKSFEYGALILKKCATSEVTIKKVHFKRYVGHTNVFFE